jgi:hypothetical protein
MPLDRLDDPCPVCQRTSGDHTLREWSTCLGAVTTDLPFEQTPADVGELAAANLRATLGIDDDVIVADHVVVKALTIGAQSGTVGVRLPAVLIEYAVGIIGAPPAPAGRAMYVGNVDAVRKFGRLVRDTSNAAANAIERRQG